MFFKGEATFKIFDNNGEYGFEMDVEGGQELPEAENIEVTEDGNTLTVTFQVAQLPGKDLSIYVEFEEDSFFGYMKIPFVGKIKFKDGKRIA